MANRRLPMRKIKEILRLHFQARLSARQIARSCSVSRATVGDYLSRTRAAQLDWKQVCQMSEAELEGQLFPPPAPRGRHRPPPDLAYVHRELRGKSVTLQLLWQEYKQVHPDGYQYSQFCDLYNRWRGKLPERQVHSQDRSGLPTITRDPTTTTGSGTLEPARSRLLHL